MDRIRAAFRGNGSGNGAPITGLDGGSAPLASSLGPRSAGGAPATYNANAYSRGSSRPSLLAGGAGRSSFATGVERFGVQSKALSYFRDPFHSMVSLPTWRFYPLFFAVYLALYCVFALLYLTFSDSCIRGLDSKFSHALWIASRTAATLGYSELLTPLPTCPAVNLLVMLQVITCSLMNFIMLGLVFARFSAPSKRARSIRFARRAVARRWMGATAAPGAAPASGDNNNNSSSAEPWWCIEVRVANLRKHTLLAPNVRMFVASLDSVDTARFALDELQIEQPERQLLALSLGLSATVTHVVRPSSPLYNLSLAEMEARLFELLVFVDGTDAMTSRQMQARHSYSTGEDGVLCAQAFCGMHLGLSRNGRMALDFTRFDETVPVGSGAGVSGVVGLRHLTFRRLAEAEGGGGGVGGAASAGGRASAGGAGGGLPPKPPPAPAVVEMTAPVAGAAPAAPYYTTSSAGGAAANPFAPRAPTTTGGGGGGGGASGGGGGGPSSAAGNAAAAAAPGSSSFSNVHL